MTYHIWGDNWPYWQDLYDAEKFIRNFVYKYSRCQLISKEKYGTIRYEWVFPPRGGVYSRLNIVVPFMSYDRDAGSVRYHFGNKGRYKIVLWRWCDSFIYRRWARYGKNVLDKAVQEACLKFPHIKDEILDDYDRQYING